MIDTREIMIGNWVNVRGQNIKVTITNRGMNISSDATPIPLTPELLLSLGFEKDTIGLGNTDFYNKIAMIRTENNGVCVFELSLFKSQYGDWGINLEEQYMGYCGHLHQLQNWYYLLTQTELEVKI